MSIRRGFVFLSAGQLAAMASAYATHIILARILGPANYGRYGVFLSILSTVAMILTAGLPEAISKFAAERPDASRSIVTQGARLQLRYSLWVAVAYALVSPLVARALNDASLTYELAVSALAIPPVAIYAVIIGGLSGERRFAAQACAVAGYGVLRCVLSVALAPSRGVWGAVAAVVIAPVLVVAATLPLVLSRSAKAVLDNRALTRFALPVATFTVGLALLMNLDLFVVKALAPHAEGVGFYTAASTIAKVPYFAFSSLGVVLLPTVSAATREKEAGLAAARQAIRWTFLASLAIAAAIAPVSSVVLQTLYGRDYASAAVPLALLVLSSTLFTLFFIVAYALNGLGQPGIAARLTGFAIALELVLVVVCARFWGPAGAAAGSCLTGLLVLVALLWAARASLGTPIGLGTFLRASLAASVTVLVGSQCPRHGLYSLALFPALIAVDAALLLAFRELSFAELWAPLKRR